MTTKFLKQLTSEEAKILLFQNEQIKSFLSEEVWEQNKISGHKLLKLVDGNELITKKTKASLGLDDGQMECVVQYLKANYPEAKFTAGLPNVPAQPKPTAPAAAAKKPAKIAPVQKA